MTDEILAKIERRRALPKNSEDYRQLNKEIKKDCRHARIAQIEQRCKEIEGLERTHNCREMHRKIKSMNNKQVIRSSGCVKDEADQVLFQTDKVKNRRADFVEGLYCDDQKSNH